MKIGKARPPAVAGTTPRRKRGDPMPEGYVFGAPTTYRPEYCQAIIKYFGGADSWDINTDAKGSSKAIPSSKLPTFERWAAEMGVGQRTLLDWRDRYPEFADAYETAKSLQKAFLMELGAAGVGGHTLALMLRTNHGMKDAPEENDDNKPLEIRIVKAVKPGSE